MSAYPPPPIYPAPPLSHHYLPPHRGGTILALGIISIVLNGCGVGIILGIMAVVMGNKDLQEIGAGRMDPMGRGTTQAGRICGIIGLCLGVLSLLLMLFYFLFIGIAIAGAAVSGAGGP